MSLKPIREEIDKIDEQLAKLFARRMECSKRVAEYKIEHGFEVVNRAREDEVLNSAAEKAGIYGNSARLLYSTILELSRALQYDMAGGGNALKNEIYRLHHPKIFSFSTIKSETICFMYDTNMPLQYTISAVG